MKNELLTVPCFIYLKLIIYIVISIDFKTRLSRISSEFFALFTFPVWSISRLYKFRRQCILYIWILQKYLLNLQAKKLRMPELQRCQKAEHWHWWFWEWIEINKGCYYTHTNRLNLSPKIEYEIALPHNCTVMAIS